MKIKTSLLFCLLCVMGVQAQERQTRFVVTPALGLGYKLSDWLHGAPLSFMMCGQVVFKEKFILDVPLQALGFKDVVFQDQKFQQFIGNVRVRHRIRTVGIGAGYNLLVLKKHNLQFTAGMALVRYREPYLTGTGGWLFSSYAVDYYAHNSAGLYARIQYNVFLSDKLYLALGSTALSCRDLSYGIAYGGCSLKF